MKGITDQIIDLEQQRETKAARLAEISNTIEAEARPFYEEEAAEFDELEKELQNLDREIRLKKAQAYSVTSAKAVDGTNMRNASASRGPTILVKNHDPDDEFQGQSFVRKVIAQWNAYNSKGQYTAAQYAKMRWGKTRPNLVEWISNVDKGAAITTDDAWAGRLVQTDHRYTGDFVEYLKGLSIYEQLPMREVPAYVSVGGQDGIGTGYIVGEGKGIGVTEMSFTREPLTPTKAAAIAVLSNEVLKNSAPSAEVLVRDGLAEAIIEKIDQIFLGDQSASGAIPAGILQGVQAVPASGTDGDSLAYDIAQAYSAFLTAKNARDIRVVMSPTRAKMIGLIKNALGQFEFPGINANGGTLLGDQVVVGDNVDPEQILLVKPSDIWRIGDMGIEVSISGDATLEMSDEPSGDSGAPTGMGGNSQKIVSMFQTDSTAFKVVRPFNFKKRRSHAVQYIDGAAYGPTPASVPTT